MFIHYKEGVNYGHSSWKTKNPNLVEKELCKTIPHIKNIEAWSCSSSMYFLAEYARLSGTYLDITLTVMDGYQSARSVYKNPSNII